MKQALQLLIVEDNPNDAELVLAELRRAGFNPQWTRVDTEPEFLAELKKSPEIVLSDFAMPQFSGLRAAELLQTSGLDIPFILISGTVGEDVAVEAMKLGATDYLLKDRTARLGKAVEQALQQKRLRDERKRTEVELQRQLHELQRWYEATLGREDRILELKREVNELLAAQQLPPRYTA
ncbi:MAG TPA: response regulator [Verrucomicrobiae bacterium]|nr:response regulator [Verrucomicrobiae bacterium]